MWPSVSPLLPLLSGSFNRIIVKKRHAVFTRELRHLLVQSSLLKKILYPLLSHSLSLSSLSTHSSPFYTFPISLSPYSLTFSPYPPPLSFQSLHPLFLSSTPTLPLSVCISSLFLSFTSFPYPSPSFLSVHPLSLSSISSLPHSIRVSSLPPYPLLPLLILPSVPSILFSPTPFPALPPVSIPLPNTTKHEYTLPGRTSSL